MPLPNEVKVNITINDIGIRSNLTTNKTIKFFEKPYFYTILTVTQTHSGASRDIEGFVQRKKPGTYQSEKSNNITGNEKIHLKSVCMKRSIVNGIREPTLYSFALDEPPGH